MNSWIVFKKELIDALRDRRTLLVVLLSSVAIGPIVLIALSALVAGIEQRAEDFADRHAGQFGVHCADIA